MRIGLVLQALAEDYRVYLEVIPVVGKTTIEDLPVVFHKWCTEIAVVELAERAVATARPLSESRRAEQSYVEKASNRKPYLSRMATPANIAKAACMFAGVRFHVVHISRLFMAPFVDPFLRQPPKSRPFCALDLDDYESKKYRRLAALYDLAGEPSAAAASWLESERYAKMEREYLPRLDLVYASSERDRDEVARGHACKAAVLPNAVRIPVSTRLASDDQIFTVLFVGNLEYYPNEDAAVFLCSDILPELRRCAPMPIRIVVVGPRPSERVTALAAIPEVVITGRVDDLPAFYRTADVAVAPIRAGGGTRIKILEALSYRRPVVSTRIGAEGLGLTDGEDVLIADTPADFRDALLLLMREPGRKLALAQRGFERVLHHNTIRNVRASLRRSLPSLPAR